MAGLAVLACVSIFYLSIPCSGQDTIKPGQFLPDGDTLISAGGRFELGFFSPGRSTNRFLGIWYKNITPQTVVWIANREAPITERAGIVNITDQGILTLRNGTHTLVWSSNSSRYLQSPVVQLLDSGNLVVKDGDDDSPDNFLWQSFDYPCDTLLPGMKMGKDLAKGVDKPLTSWKSSEDPGKGEYSLEIDPRGYPQGYVKKGNTTLSRKGSWWGERFTKTSAVDGQGPRITYELVFNKNEVYFKFESTGTSRYTINPSGLVQRYFWNDQTSSWMVLSTGQVDECENYALCGAYGSCYLHKSPVCSCMQGFRPKSAQDWNLTKWSDGCVRSTPFSCNRNDGFLKYSGIKVPDTSSSLYIRSIDLAECADLCLNNCSCTAYASLDISNGGSGCLLWFDDLIDTKGSTDSGQDLYVKVAASELVQFRKARTSGKKMRTVIIGITVMVLFLSLVTLGISCFIKRRRKLRMAAKAEGLPIFDLSRVAAATNNFSSSNKLGEGGFGPVYRGRLPEGQAIAVKRLSRSSGQGSDELKNEVVLFSKLQHRNLVKLLGCCVCDDEKMLIYECMPNKSLDSFIFGTRYELDPAIAGIL